MTKNGKHDPTAAAATTGKRVRPRGRGGRKGKGKGAAVALAIENLVEVHRALVDGASGAVAFAPSAGCGHAPAGGVTPTDLHASCQTS